MYIVQRQILKVVYNWSIISTALATLHLKQQFLCSEKSPESWAIWLLLHGQCVTQLWQDLVLDLVLAKEKFDPNLVPSADQVCGDKGVFTTWLDERDLTTIVFATKLPTDKTWLSDPGPLGCIPLVDPCRSLCQKKWSKTSSFAGITSCMDGVAQKTIFKCFDLYPWKEH